MTAVFVMPFLRASLYALLTLLTFSVWDMKSVGVLFTNGAEKNI